jgi:hypothetical protein
VNLQACCNREGTREDTSLPIPVEQGEAAILARRFCDNAFISTPYALLTTAPEGASREGHESTHLRADQMPRIVRIHPDFGRLMADG